MTNFSHWAGSCTMALLFAGYAPAASAQDAAAADPHEAHRSQVVQPAAVDQAAKPMGHEMMARMQEMKEKRKALDARVEALTADMNVLTGELKIAAMASLLTVMVERDTVMRAAMADMHEHCSMMKTQGAAGPQP